MQKTQALAAVAGALLADPDGQHWGYRLSRASHVTSGVLYPMLTRMRDAGWLVDGWEDPNTLTTRRPPRRYYRITEEGKAALHDVAAS